MIILSNLLHCTGTESNEVTPVPSNSPSLGDDEIILEEPDLMLLCENCKNGDIQAMKRTYHKQVGLQTLRYQMRRLGD